MIYPSPNASYVLAFTDSDAGSPCAFTIKTAAGEQIFDSRRCDELREVITFKTEFVRWSPDSKIVAVASDEGKIGFTYVLGLGGQGFQLLDTPLSGEGYDNPYIVPIRWLSGRRLVVETTGPHAGKNIPSGYRGRATIRYSLNPSRCEIVYKHIREFEYEAD
jgi:hypothetical protein